MLTGSFRFGVAVPGIARFNVSGALGSLALPLWLNLNTARQSRNAKFKISNSRRNLRKITTSHELVLQRASIVCRPSGGAAYVQVNVVIERGHWEP